MKFATAVKTQEITTTNGMPTLASSGGSNVDFFFAVGASRKLNDSVILGKFGAAIAEDKELALRIALWSKDIREGAGERKVFRTLLKYLCQHHPHEAVRVVRRLPELGRWDDMYHTTGIAREEAFKLIRTALFQEKNQLCAKWVPRRGKDFNDLLKFMNMYPSKFRKLVSGLTDVVETKMCAKQWDQIDYSKLPSVAAARYNKAFFKHDPKRYEQYKNDLKSGKEGVKINAGAIYPYDIIRSLNNSGDPAIAVEQWKALPNYVGDNSILPMVDVSGSMITPASGSVTCMDVALSLGLYLSDKNKGHFKDVVLTFSEKPELLFLAGDLQDKLNQLSSSAWGMNTNIVRAFEKVLKLAKDNNIKNEDMPGTIVILSDMQFDVAVKTPDKKAFDIIDNMYEDAGYERPNLVFWNLNNHAGAPVSFNEDGTALVSGFSPSIMKSILGAKKFNAESIMLDTVNKDRYNL